jgi:hypothetical protein
MYENARILYHYPLQRAIADGNIGPYSFPLPLLKTELCIQLQLLSRVSVISCDIFRKVRPPNNHCVLPKHRQV